MLDRTTFVLNTAQCGDALTLLRSLPASCTPLTFFDPQHRAVLDKLKFGNACCLEIARVLRPSGYLMRFIDTFCLVEAHHLHIPRKVLAPVDLIAWDNLRLGQGKRSRRRGDYLLVLQKPPIKARATWRDRGIPSRWVEKIDLKRYPRELYPHTKPIGLITRLIGAVSEPNSLIIDPAAGSFAAMHAAHQLGREFVGVDLAYTNHH